jgi:hypothetical protein
MHTNQEDTRFRDRLVAAGTLIGVTVFFILQMLAATVSDNILSGALLAQLPEQITRTDVRGIMAGGPLLLIMAALGAFTGWGIWRLRGKRRHRPQN